MELFIYVFATSVGCEVRYVGTTELKKILYISARVLSARSTYQRNLDAQIKDLVDVQFPGGEQISNLK